MLLIVNLFYGAGFTVSKMVMPEFIKPFGFIAVRVSVTLILFVILHEIFIREKIQKKDFGLLALCSLFGVVLNMEMFFVGLSITTPINAALIMIMTPILTIIISSFVGREALTGRKIAGIVLGTLGALIILSGRGFDFSSKTMLGDLCILINAASYAVYLVIAKPLMKKYHPLTVIRWVFTFGAVPVLIFGLGQLQDVRWFEFSTTTWLAVVFVVMGTTFFAYLFNMLALREVNSSVVSAYIYLQPILATIISILVKSDTLTMEKVISGVLIFSGVFLVSYSGQMKLFGRVTK